MTAVATIQPRSVLVDMSSRYGMEPAAFEATLRATVCKGNVSREEFAAFLLVAKEYGLNPMTKELYAFPAKGGGIQPIVSIDGWSRIINDHPMFDGMEFEDVRDGDDLIAITCRMHRKDRSRSIEATEYMAECRRGTDVWKTWPRRMLRHKAMIQCARYAFGFSGIVDPDEYERMETVRDVTRQGPNLTARLSAPTDRPAEGFNAVHSEPQTEISDDGADQPSDPSPETPASEMPPSPDAGDPFPGDPVPAGEAETAEPAGDQSDEGPGSAVEAPENELVAWADTLISRLPFAGLSDLKTMESGGSYRGRIKALRDQAPDKAAQVEKAMKDALESFG